MKYISDAYNIKYRITPDKLEEAWQKVLLVANRKCYDTKPGDQPISNARSVQAGEDEEEEEDGDD